MTVEIVLVAAAIALAGLGADLHCRWAVRKFTDEG
jgi:hypothetical protein